MKKNFICSKHLYNTVILNKYKKIEKKVDKLNSLINLEIKKEFQKKIMEYPINKVINMVEVELTYEEIKISGWDLIGFVDFLKEGNIVNNFQNDSFNFRNMNSNCEYCNINRYRKTIYVLQNINTKKYKQVGSTCLKDFLGINPTNIFIIRDIIKSIKENLYSYSLDLNTFDVEDILPISAMLVRLYGYVSKKKAEGLVITSIVDKFFNFIYEKEKNETEIIIDEDKELSKKVINWIKIFDDNNDYIQNLKVLFKEKYIKEKYIGYIISSIAAYYNYCKDQEELQERNKNINNTFVGTIKERKEIEVKILNVIWWESSYGTIYFHIMKNNNNNIFIWKTSKKLEVNQNYKLLGTIKSHNVYKGINQTELTRCKIIN